LRAAGPAQEGFGTPIGSHMVPSDAGYVDLTGANPYNPEKAKALIPRPARS
jgi:peptide/nickel transport system substrate-binding protein